MAVPQRNIITGPELIVASAGPPVSAAIMDDLGCVYLVYIFVLLHAPVPVCTNVPIN